MYIIVYSWLFQPVNQEVAGTRQTNHSEEAVGKPNALTQVAEPPPVTPQTVDPPVLR